VSGLRPHDHHRAHSEKENAAATRKRTYGFHPLLCFPGRPNIAAGEALVGPLRPANGGSNTAADHIAVLDMALAWAARACPPRRRPGGQDMIGALQQGEAAPSAGLRRPDPRSRRRVRPAGHRIPLRIPRGWAYPAHRPCPPQECWHPARQVDERDGEESRDGAQVAEATWASGPERSRQILRDECHPARIPGEPYAANISDASTLRLGFRQPGRCSPHSDQRRREGGPRTVSRDSRNCPGQHNYTAPERCGCAAQVATADTRALDKTTELSSMSGRVWTSECRACAKTSRDPERGGGRFGVYEWQGWR